MNKMDYKVEVTMILRNKNRKTAQSRNLIYLALSAQLLKANPNDKGKWSSIEGRIRIN
jgi:hypothetical protein